jgi:hypothetical protein
VPERRNSRNFDNHYSSVVRRTVIQLSAVAAPAWFNSIADTLLAVAAALPQELSQARLQCGLSGGRTSVSKARWDFAQQTNEFDPPGIVGRKTAENLGAQAADFGGGQFAHVAILKS